MSSLGCPSTEPFTCRYVAHLFLCAGFPVSWTPDGCLEVSTTCLFGVFAPMVLLSLALRDVVTLSVECVFIVVRSEGLSVFC